MKYTEYYSFNSSFIKEGTLYRIPTYVPGILTEIITYLRFPLFRVSFSKHWENEDLLERPVTSKSGFSIEQNRNTVLYLYNRVLIEPNWSQSQIVVLHCSNKEKLEEFKHLLCQFRTTEEIDLELIVSVLAVQSAI